MPVTVNTQRAPLPSPLPAGHVSLPSWCAGQNSSPDVSCYKLPFPPFIFSTCRKSSLFFRAAAMSYHCQSSHYISAFLSNFSFNLSASLSIPHFSLASLLNDPFDHFHFLCPDALLQLSDLPKCSSFTFHTFIKLLSPFLSEFSLAVLSSVLHPNSSYSFFCPVETK